MFPTLGDLLGFDLAVDTHSVFVGARGAHRHRRLRARGTPARQHRRPAADRGHRRPGRRGASSCGSAPGCSTSTCAQNATLAEQWAYGNRSILGGLVGAWLGVHVAKRLCGYRLRTGDLFAPAVALGMAVGRIGCLLTELPGTPTGHVVGDHPRRRPPLRARAAPAGIPLHPSFLYEIAFHLAAFAAIWFWLRHRPVPPRRAASSGTSRPTASSASCVEFVRGNEVVWLGLTRPQLFLAVTIPLRPAAHRRCRRVAAPTAEPAATRQWCAVSTRTGPGMPLRGDRIHRYVNAFCPLCHEEQPDRPLAEVQRLSGLAGRARRTGSGWSAAAPTHGLVRTLYDESPEILTLPRAVDRADQGAHARRGRQLRAGAGGLRRRAARDADPAHLHPARGPARPLQPQVPDLLRRLGAGARLGRAARAGARLDRRAAVARERPHRRAHAQRRRADALPVAGRAARRGRRAPDRAGAGQHQRPRHRPGRRAARRCCGGTASGSRSTCSTTASRPRRPPTTAAPTSAGSRSGRSSGSPAPGSSPPSR